MLPWLTLSCSTICATTFPPSSSCYIYGPVSVAFSSIFDQMPNLVPQGMSRSDETLMSKSTDSW